MEWLRVENRAIKEFLIYWAGEAAKKEGEIGREVWLWAFDRYDFSEADPNMLERLTGVAGMFRGWKKNGGR